MYFGSVLLLLTIFTFFLHRTLCPILQETKDSYLFEVRICFDKKLNLVDCDGIPGYPTNCGLKKEIIYPGTVPSAYSVIQI